MRWICVRQGIDRIPMNFMFSYVGRFVAWRYAAGDTALCSEANCAEMLIHYVSVPVALFANLIYKPNANQLGRLI